MLDWFIPQTIALFDSEINGRIKVVKEFGHLAVNVNGYQQSGNLVERIWKAAFEKGLTLSQKKEVKKVLMLGLGAGTIAKVINDNFPNVKLIHTVEVDPVMVKIAKKFFGVDKISNLEITTEDAFLFVKKAKGFDLLVVDIYIGGKSVSKEQREFWLDVYKMSPKYIAVNFLQANSNIAVENPAPEELFDIVKKVKKDYNTIFFLSPRFLA